MSAIWMFVGFAPWILFSILTESYGADVVGWVALGACLLSLVLALYGARGRGGVKIIDLAGVATFGIIAIIAAFGDTGVDEVLANFGRSFAVFVLAGIMAISVVTIPFTEQYARDSVEPEYWHTPVFRSKNRAISALWAIVVFLIGAAHLIAEYWTWQADLAASHTANIVLNWVVPIVLVIFAVKRTRAIAENHPVGEAAPVAA